MTWFDIVILEISGVSAIAALVAVYVTWGDFRRSNSVVLTLEKCSASMVAAVDENGGRPYAHLTLLLRNHGLPLHSMTVKLAFQGVPEFGTWGIWLRKTPAPGLSDTFAKGMLADVSLKSYEAGDVNCSMLLHLTNPRRQKACLLIYSQEYLAAQFPLAGLFDGLKVKWNTWAWRFNSLFDRQIPDEKGKPLLKTYTILPMLLARGWQLSQFVNGIASARKLAQGGFRMEVPHPDRQPGH